MYDIDLEEFCQVEQMEKYSSQSEIVNNLKRCRVRRKHVSKTSLSTRFNLQGRKIIQNPPLCVKGFPRGTVGKEPSSQSRRTKRHGFDPLVGKIPRKRKCQPIPIFSPGESFMGKGAWQAAVHGLTKSWTRLKQLSNQVYRTS